MENHPIPQDVTGFKFKLIGSVTVKQFLYILGAAALCGVFFIMPITFLIKWPAIILIASLGAGLAFLPIEGRPMDVMLINFLKAIPAENRFLFHKTGAEGLIHDFFMPQSIHKAQTVAAPQKDTRRELLLNQLVRKNVAYKMDEQERKQLNTLSGMFSDSDIPITGLQSIDVPAQNSPSAIVRPPIQNTPIQADAPPPPPPAPIVEVVPQVVAETATETPVETPALVQPVAPTPAIESIETASTAQTIKPENQIATGFPQIPDTPNIVLGIVKDPRGKVLPNIIVEVVDENQNPVRAFKTNALGQFSSATPLSQGKYKILLEDTRHLNEFSPIDIEMTNEIFQPLEIISVDQREKLRQELFGATAPGN